MFHASVLDFGHALDDDWRYIGSRALHLFLEIDAERGQASLGRFVTTGQRADLQAFLVNGQSALSEQVDYFSVRQLQ